MMARKFYKLKTAKLSNPRRDQKFNEEIIVTVIDIENATLGTAVL